MSEDDEKIRRKYEILELEKQLKREEERLRELSQSRRVTKNATNLPSQNSNSYNFRARSYSASSSRIKI